MLKDNSEKSSSDPIKVPVSICKTHSGKSDKVWQVNDSYS